MPGLNNARVMQRSRSAALRRGRAVPTVRGALVGDGHCRRGTGVGGAHRLREADARRLWRRRAHARCVACVRDRRGVSGTHQLRHRRRTCARPSPGPRRRHSRIDDLRLRTTVIGAHMNPSIAELFERREHERYALHSRHLDEQMVRVLRTIGYDVGFCRAEGQYLYDREDSRYLDLLSGFGVFAVGRNHPAMREALKSVLDGELPNLVQMDVSTLAGLLAERLLARVPYLDKAFFANSGAEAVEAAIKFARAATGRSGIVYCDHAFHGLSYGALSLNGDNVFRDGFGPLLPDCHRIPFNNLFALEKALHSRKMAAFIVEPIQGKGVNLPDGDYLAGAG